MKIFTYNVQERDPLKCINHWNKLNDWYIPLWGDGDDIHVPQFCAIIEESGLADLKRFSYLYISYPLVSSFVERWQPETNTFHMPFDEMTITLDDVDALLGIPVTEFCPHIDKYGLY